MKNILFIALILTMVWSCKKNEPQPPKDYAVVHGKITNPIDSLDLRLFNPETRKNVIIKADENGNFRDTLKLEQPATFTGVYGNTFYLYLKNNMDLELNFNTKDFTNSLGFSGKGEEENNFLRFKAKESKVLYGDDYKDYYNLNQNDFDTKTTDYVNKLHKELDAKHSKLDSSFVNQQKESLMTF